jgi:uncharacterized protein (DUF885 family)
MRRSPQVIDRRQFLGTAASLIAVCVAASLRAATPAAAAQRADADARLNALFDVFMDERFAKNPQLLTSLGLDKGKYAWARAKLNDASLERARAAKLENASRLKRLRAFGNAGLEARDRANFDTVEFQMETLARAAPFPYGEFVRPYVVSQLTGAYQEVPTFLDRQHQIASREDAQTYLARLRAFAQVLDEESERVRHDAGLKVVPPDFLIDRTLEQMRQLRSAAPGESILTTSLVTRTAKLGLTGDYATQATRIVARAGGARCRCWPTARGRGALSGGAAFCDHDRHDTRGGAPARGHAGCGAQRPHGHVAAQGGQDLRHGA